MEATLGVFRVRLAYRMEVARADLLAALRHLGALEDAEYLRRLTGLTDLGLDGSHAGRTYLAASGRYQRARETALLLEDLWDELFPGQAPPGRLQFRLEHDLLAASLLPAAVTGRSGWLSRRRSRSPAAESPSAGRRASTSIDSDQVQLLLAKPVGGGSPPCSKPEERHFAKHR